MSYILELKCPMVSDDSRTRTFVRINMFKMVSDHVLQAKRKLEKGR